MSNQTIEHILIRLINLNVNLNAEEYDKEITEGDVLYDSSKS